MSQRKEQIILLVSLLLTGGLIAWGYRIFTSSSLMVNVNNNQQSVANNSSPSENTTFQESINVPEGTTIIIDGSTSMVQYNEEFKKAFVAEFPSARVLTQARGTNEGIKALLNGQIDLAAISRPLTKDETAQGLVSVSISQDAIAIMVGIDNPICRQGLKDQQIKDIFQGKLTNWSQLGREAGIIEVINRPPISGTHQAFQELVLKGQNFGTTNNIRTQERDETTGIIQKLGKNGISYATYKQVEQQSTACAVSINGIVPQSTSLSTNYPYVRTLSYVYQEPIGEGLKAFLAFIQKNNQL